MSIMKTKMLYAIIVILVIAVVLFGYFYFSSSAQYVAGGERCPKWKCTPTQTYSCPSGTKNYTCSGSSLTCYVCSTTYTTKDYYVTLISVAYQTVNNVTNLVGIYTVNNYTFNLGVGKTTTLPDGIIFGVNSLTLNYSTFYLQSTYETKSSSLYAPFPKSTTINLLVSKTETCNPTTYTCSSGYTPTCSGNTLTCTGKTNYICSIDQPFPNCVTSGICRFCPY
jgi:hypothetical protein